MSIYVCLQEDCGQEARPGFVLCWPHWLQGQAVADERITWRTVHGMIRWLWEEKILADYSEGPHDVYVAAERVDAQDNCYHYDIWGGLAALLADIPDAHNAMMVRGEGMDYYVNDLTRPPYQTVVVTLYLDRSSAEEEAEEKAEEERRGLASWQHHITHTRVDKATVVWWCGVKVEHEWAFTSIDHAVNSVAGGFLQSPCPRCVAAVWAVLQPLVATEADVL